MEKPSASVLMSILGAMAPLDSQVIRYIEPRPRYGYPPPQRNFRNAGEDTGWGSCRKAKNLDNSPDRAKGMKEFFFGPNGVLIEDSDWSYMSEEQHDRFVAEGMIIYAGTAKAARNKHALLARSTP